MNKTLLYLLLISFIWLMSCGDDDEPANSPPTLSNRSFRIDEDIETGDRVGSISAFDLDNDPLTYSILSGNTDNTFDLNSSSGELTVRSNEKIDFQVISQYILTVEVSDGKAKASAQILIDIDGKNRPPIVSEQTFSVSEDAWIGLEVGVIQATDPNPNSTLIYEIVDGNEDFLFELERFSGLLTLKSTLKLDFESKDTYALTVSVADREGLSSTTTVTVNILDTTDPNASFELHGDGFTMQEGLIRELGKSKNEFHTVRNYTLVDGEFSFSEALDDFVVNSGTIGVFGVLFSKSSINFSPGEFIYVDTTGITVGDVIGKDFIYAATIIIDGNNDGSVSINEEDIVYGVTGGSIKVISNGAEPPTLNYNVEVTLYDVASKQYVNSTKTNLHFEYSGDYEYIDQRSSRSRTSIEEIITPTMAMNKKELK